MELHAKTAYNQMSESKEDNSKDESEDDSLDDESASRDGEREQLIQDEGHESSSEPQYSGEDSKQSSFKDV